MNSSSTWVLVDAAFVWSECQNEEDKDCHAVLRESKIIGRAGHAFGAERSYMRLSLVNSQDDFNLLHGCTIDLRC